ncbi:MAG: hypothetical protein H0V66_00795 [Bdellovibrionales bacterium]|nr:hypothetical protein [Bdellovibrionales bacterium]
MKMQLIALLTLISASAMATEIQGTLMLKGTLKTKIVVNGVKTVCKIKVEKVKNLLEEDSAGNPAYQAKIQISLDGNDLERGVKVKLDKELTVINLHSDKDVRTVKDLDYFSSAEKVKVTIDSEGRLLSTSFPFQSQTIQCNF